MDSMTSNTGSRDAAIDFEQSGRNPADDGLCDHLDPAVFSDPGRVDWIRQELRAGSLVVISNAFDRDLAERVHARLAVSESWRPVRRYDEHEQFCRESIRGDETVPELVKMHAMMSSDSTRRWVEDLSGCSCDGTTELEAQLFLPGHYCNMSSGALGRRTVGLFWHLSKDWEASWGGDLAWHLSGSVIQPSFNTMYMFRVDPRRSPFSVSPVIPAARGRRLSVVGWWSTTEDRDARGQARPMGARTAVPPQSIDDEIFTLRSYHDVDD